MVCRLLKWEAFNIFIQITCYIAVMKTLLTLAFIAFVACFFEGKCQSVDSSTRAPKLKKEEKVSASTSPIPYNKPKAEMSGFKPKGFIRTKYNSQKKSPDIDKDECFNSQESPVALGVDTTSTGIIDGEYLGYQACLVNNSKTDIYFLSHFGRLMMRTQAIDQNGNWADVQLHPIGCSGGYEDIILQSGYHWTLTVPKFEGSYKTKLRVVLFFKEVSDYTDWPWDEDRHAICSNEFEGSVNPGQFIYWDN